MPDLFELLRSLRLPEGDYAIFGSGPMIIRGIVEPGNDLDIISRGSAWNRAREVGVVEYLPQHDVEVVSCFEGAITIGTRWAIGDFDVDDLIDTAEIIDDLPFVRMEHVILYKQIAGRPKDLQHLQRLNEAESDQ